VPQCAPIILAVANYFLSPELRSRFWPFEKVATVPVPKAAVNKNHRVVLWKYKVWLTGKPAVVKSKAKPSSMQYGSQQLLRVGVFTSYAGHHPASNFFRYNVDHQSSVSSLLARLKWK
jgi:hypothetical protein